MEYRGPVRVISDGNDLGEAVVVLRATDDARVASGWEGRMVNSGPLLWGAAGTRIDLGLPDGRQVAAAVHASGRLVGLGPSPFGDRDG